MRVHSLVLFVVVAGGYVLGYELASNWFSAEDQGASFFPAAGVTLAALVLVPRRQWPVVLAAAASAELALDIGNGTSVIASAGYALANVSEPLVGALLLTTIIGVVDLRQMRDLAAFIGCAVIVAPIVGGVIAATTFVFVDGNSGWERFAFEWWSGDGLGVLVVGGALLSLRSAPDLPTRRIVEGVLVAALAIAATAAVFELGWFEFVYLALALLVVLAFRVGTTAVAVTSALVAFVAAGATSEAQDFWASVDISAANRVLYLQLTLSVIIATMLALAAEIAARERIAVELLQTESERAAALEGRARAELEEELAVELQHVASALAAAETTQAVVRIVATQLIQALGGSEGSLFLVDRDGDLLRLVGTSPGDESTEYREIALDSELPPAAALRGREPAFLGDVDAFRAAYPGTADPDGSAWAQVPLLVGLRPVGLLAIAYSSPQTFDRRQRDALISICDAVAQALRRAELQAAADVATADAALLARLGEVLERATGLEERALALVRALVAGRASLAVVHTLDDSVRPRTLAQASSDPGSSDVDGTVLAGLARAAVSADGLAGASAGDYMLLGVPLRARDRVLGVLTMGTRAGSDVRVTPVLIQRIATRAAIAFDNALLYEQERDVSHSLQMGLLGEKLGSTPNATIATAYRPGTVALEVGGDWYDAFTLPDGRLALVVGDVVGHGLEAAVAMGQLRGAVRALAPMGSPHEVLEGLDLFVEQLPAAAMATLVYAELGTEGRLAYACAGHPPPLLVPSDGEPRLLWAGRSTPLGSSFTAGRDEAVEYIAAGDTIVLYTDGLVERRDDGIAAGLDALLEVAAAGDRTPAMLVDDVLSAVLKVEEQDDDACVLALRRVAPESRFVRSFPATPAQVASMRRALAAWLERLDLDEDRRRDAVLATAEAAANAAEHAYGFDGKGIVRVEAWLSNRALELSIHDRGRWRPPTPDTDRGRGRKIMERLTGRVTIEHDRAGTVVRMSFPAGSRASA